MQVMSAGAASRMSVSALSGRGGVDGAVARIALRGLGWE